jgi:hypothetical protein
MAPPKVLTKIYGSMTEYIAGRLKTALPVAQNDAANKEYVDNLVLFSTSADYKESSLVFYNGNLWMCITANGPSTSTGSIEPGTDDNYWMSLFDFLVAASGRKGVGVPVGAVIVWSFATNPSDMENWLECNGQTITQSAYPELYALTGAKVPDFRGLFLRGTGGKAAAIGVMQGHAMRDFSGAGEIWVDWGASIAGNGIFQHVRDIGISCAKSTWGGWTSKVYRLSLSAAGMPVADEVRPDNMAVRWLIRALP